MLVSIVHGAVVITIAQFQYSQHDVANQGDDVGQDERGVVDQYTIE
jgi:hypothetical protein